jgi:hypothetical protein
MNEGKFPAGKISKFIYSIRCKARVRITYFWKRRDIYVSFLPSLQRAKIFICYNTESDGLDAGEKSRFITQLVEQQPNHNLS